jgi:exodeoxyribonuclease III
MLRPRHEATMLVLTAHDVDRQARKGALPSDHAPLVVDLDEPGRQFDAGWAAADARIAARRSG